jgi:glycosyltransferase involved in cell wall biosynthesis
MVTKVEKKYGLGEKRMFSMDHLGNQDYLSVLRQSQLLINSSISEGTCGSILEAMLYKVPVLARDNKGNTEIICSSKNGYVFDSPEQFSYLYRLIFSEENQLSTILE